MDKLVHSFAVFQHYSTLKCDAQLQTGWSPSQHPQSQDIEFQQGRVTFQAWNPIPYPLNYQQVNVHTYIHTYIKLY